MIRIRDDKAWLLIKINDEYAISLKKHDITRDQPDSVIKKIRAIKIPRELLASLKSSRFPQHISPELATLVDKPPLGRKWLHEIKDATLAA